jgi:S1-C subfamily serine protease
MLHIARDFQMTGERTHCSAGLRLAHLLLLLCFCGTITAVSGCGSQRGTIGANLGQQANGRLFIREVPPGLAAARAGLEPGDEITLINGRDVRDFDDKGIHKLLSGDIGEPVKLTVLRGDQVLHVTLLRTPAPRAASSSGSL